MYSEYDENQHLRELYNDLKKEFDNIFAKLYLANEENKMLLKENRQLKKKIDYLLDKIVNYASRLGEKPELW